MTQKNVDLWPSRFVAATGGSPIGILRDQAALLGTKTDNVVQATVKSSATRDDEVEHRFYLLAPALDNYRYLLFTVRYRVDKPFPLKLQEDVKWQTIKSEERLLAALADIFKSERTSQVIASLIEQSEAA
jgi:hypothetical protein